MGNTHHTALAIKVRIDLLLERGLVHVARADRDANCGGLFFRLARDVLPDSNGRVDAAAFLEERANGAAGSLRRHQDNVYVWRGYDLGVILVHDGKAVGEVERLALRYERGELRPRRGLRGVGEQVHDDRAAIDGLFDREQRLSGHLGAEESVREAREVRGACARTQPSSQACFQLSPFSRTPTMTLSPLSRAFRPCPWP
jgi:hypothetical protein